MTLAILLLACTNVLFSNAVPVKIQELPLISIPCNDSGAEAAADLSIRQLNENRKQGYVFGLKRITNVQEQYEEEKGTVYYLTLDVTETQCHVLSREDWKDCEPKRPYEAVSGECKVIFHINKPRRIAHLHSYVCALKPAIVPVIGCPGCPSPQPVDDVKIQEIVKRGLKQFNNENNHIKYFILGQITRGTVQVVAGTAYNVEFTIQESSCNKSHSVDERTHCPPTNHRPVDAGYCKARGIAHWSAPDNANVTISCKFFKTEATVDEQTHQDHHTDAETSQHQHGEKGEKHGEHSHQKHNHKHGYEHDNKGGHGHHHDSSESHEHDHQHQHPKCHLKRHRLSDYHKTVGKITHIRTGGNSTEITLTEEKDGKKPLRSAKSSFPEGEPAACTRILCSSKPFIRPFPENPSTSDLCPGEDKFHDQHVPAPRDPKSTALEDTTPIPN